MRPDSPKQGLAAIMEQYPEVAKIVSDLKVPSAKAAENINLFAQQFKLGISTSERAVRRARQNSLKELTDPNGASENIGPETPFAPSVEFEEDRANDTITGVAKIQRKSDQPLEDEQIYAAFGVDSAIWEITKLRKSQWDAPNGDLREAVKAEFSRRVPESQGEGSTLDFEDLERYLGSYPAYEVKRKDPNGRVLLFAIGDTQAGKPDGGGSDALVERFCAVVAKFKARLVKNEGVTLVAPWLGDCFAPETEIVTRQGIVKIGDVAGQDVEIRDGNGGWVPVTIKSYGVQKLSKVTWTAQGTKKVTYCTPGHQWLVSKPYGNKTERVRTEDLKPGYKTIKSTRGKGLPTLSQDGVRAGFIFGDGSDSPQGSRAGFYGDKDQALIKWFDGIHIYEDGRGDWRTNGVFPRSWKTSAPSMDEGTSFLYGWLAGYFAADGCVDTRGGATLSSAKRENLEAARSIASVLGIDTWPIREVQRTGYGDEPSALYSMAFSTKDLPEEFFLIPAHRERLGENKGNKLHWIVESVETTDRVEEVFCCEVPTTQSFMLADGLLTSNCIEGLVSQNGRMVAKLDLTVTEQVRLVQRLMIHMIRELAPHTSSMIIPVVGGNHDEAYRLQDQGPSDSWAIQAGASVKDALEFDTEGRFDHVKFVFPKSGEHGATLTINGKGEPYKIHFEHGHMAKSPEKMVDWWKGQAMGNTDAGLAHMLMTAHWHHLRVQQTYGRVWVQIPALEGGSDWYTQRTGDHSPAGAISMEIIGGQVGFEDLTIHSA